MKDSLLLLLLLCAWHFIILLSMPFWFPALISAAAHNQDKFSVFYSQSVQKFSGIHPSILPSILPSIHPSMHACMHTYIHIPHYSLVEIMKFHRLGQDPDRCGENQTCYPLHHKTITYARTYVRTYVCMHTCMYACMHACMHVLFYFIIVATYLKYPIYFVNQ